MEADVTDVVVIAFARAGSALMTRMSFSCCYCCCCSLKQCGG